MTTIRRILTALIGVTVLLGVAACGGGESPEAETQRTIDSVLEQMGASDSTLPDSSISDSSDSSGLSGLPDPSEYRMEVEFEEVPGATVRFVNVFPGDGSGSGSGTGVDVYWGRSISTGKLATTVPFGSISDAVPLEVESNPMFDSGDGEQELVVSYYPEGATEGQPIGTSTELLDDGATRFVGVIGSSGPAGVTGTTGASTMLSQLDGISSPPAGQALVILNDLGVRGIDGGDFLTVSPQGQCDEWELLNDIDSGNNGTAYAAPAGPADVAVSDANTDCATGLAPVNVDIAAGGLYVLYPYGTTVADRQVLVLDASE